MQYAKENNIKSLLLLVDFENAFDCVPHAFIEKWLDFFGLSSGSVKGINILTNSFYANTVHAGNISVPFLLGRDTKQGDPISSLLFIMCVELYLTNCQKKSKDLE